MSNITHEFLVDCARRWLLKPSKSRMACALVATEIVTNAIEQPDAIGWNGTHSVLVECKASRSDYKSDARKMFRRHESMGMGAIRYYMAPMGMLQPEEIPEAWGLVEVNENGKTRVKKLHQNTLISDYNARGEVALLLSLIRRLKVQSGNHIAIKAYTVDHTSEPKATVSINEEELRAWWYRHPLMFDGTFIHRMKCDEVDKHNMRVALAKHRAACGRDQFVDVVVPECGECVLGPTKNMSENLSLTRELYEDALKTLRLLEAALDVASEEIALMLPASNVDENAVKTDLLDSAEKRMKTGK